MRQRRLSIRCFSFIEIMVVVVIIAVLAAIVMPKFTGRAQEARENACGSQISIFQTSLSTYELDSGTFPTTAQGLEALFKKPTSPPVPLNWRGPYLDKIPLDPWGSPYVFKCPGTHNIHSYDIYSLGPDKTESDKDIGNW
jgi:general secretion pathway protein G